ncbi:hypothetical protein [Xenorhabdus littoralis]|uniref:hypothetical protein n=1 Tax=Xenorhabdus littoralis TaxID=2582835 RepID=UPI0029E8061C|nr:hypothetical protein [Xenorhabdus sp. Reich]
MVNSFYQDYFQLLRIDTVGRFLFHVVRIILKIYLQSLNTAVSVAKPVFWDIAATKSISMLLIAAITDFVTGDFFEGYLMTIPQAIPCR